ncbi:MAG: ABC transporter permease [Anaerolineae bacterium]|nr:MAG: ABC transporter permease [Anaerolineae bacterium]
MKVFDIALKDLLRSFRSAFLVVMMFVAPLLLTGLIYFAFGRAGGGRFDLPLTRVQVANLDQPDPHSGLAAGQMLAEYLQGDDLAGLLQVTVAPDKASARTAVERQEADVAVLIPADVTFAALNPDATAIVALYHDPTLTIQPGIVRLIVSDYIDGFSGVKIALQVTAQGLAERGLELDTPTVEQVEREYVAWVQSAGHTHEAEDTADPILTTRTPAGESPPADLISTLLGSVMARMMIFFAFFTGAAGAASLLYEQEEGTLARLFTTPTPRAAILGGKFFAILLTLAVQVPLLLFVGRLLFGIRWGQPATVALLTLGLIVAAAGFGVFLMSFVKTARQSGPVMGLTVTLTGLLGGLMPTGNPSQPGVFDKVSLLLPQGWAMRGWQLAVNGATPAEAVLSTGVLAVAGLVLFAIGLLGFRRRFV